jgi:chemotaxis response regulator CheB
VHVTRSREELREDVARNRPEAVVLNIEFWRLTDVENLHRDFPGLPIVCTHRIPDEEMWMAALEAGASDVCPADDVANVLTSVLRSTALSRSAAA